MYEKFQYKLAPEEINALPLGRFEGPVTLVEDEADLSAALASMQNETLLGFDTETRPAFKKGVRYLPSLVQLAGSTGVHLIRLSRLASLEGLLQVLSDPEITKCGVAVRDDLLDLQRFQSFQPAGFVDLGQVARKHKLESYGLRNLAAKFLGIRISKSAKCTNWNRRELTPQQVLYAATDAWISREIHLRFQELQLV